MMKRQPYQMPEDEKPYRIVIRAPESLIEGLRERAHRQGVSLNTIMVEAFELYIRRSGEHEHV